VAVSVVMFVVLFKLAAFIVEDWFCAHEISVIAANKLLIKKYLIVMALVIIYQ
jgi:hypothetical protein